MEDKMYRGNVIIADEFVEDSREEMNDVNDENYQDLKISGLSVSVVLCVRVKVH